jgi:signal peptidase
MIKRVLGFIKNIFGNKIVKKVFKYLGNIIFALIIVVVILSIYGNIQAKGREWVVPTVGKYRWMTVLSGSMKPVFNPGDLIVDKKVNTNDLKVGDVVTYMYGGNFLSTHRIVEISKDDKGKPAFKTKGDNNNAVDNQVISSNAIVGKYIFRIPLIGYVFLKLKGLPGIIAIWILFIYVAGMEIYRNVKAYKIKIQEEIQKKIQEEIQEKAHEDNQEEPTI